MAKSSLSSETSLLRDRSARSKGKFAVTLVGHSHAWYLRRARAFAQIMTSTREATTKSLATVAVQHSAQRFSDPSFSVSSQVFFFVDRIGSPRIFETSI
jgi:hypothetical protein